MKINQLFFFILFILFSQPSFANCARGGGIFADKSISTSTIALPANVVVESRSYSAGDPLYDSGWKSGSNSDLTISGCGRNYVVGFFYLNGPQVDSPGGTQVMPTNIPGLGVRVTAQNQAGPYDGAMPIDNNWHDGDRGSDHELRNSQYKVELVALGGPISSGQLSFGSPLAQVEFRESRSHTAYGDVASNVALTNTNVTIKAMGCNADVSSINFAFGSIKMAEFDSTTKIAAPDTQTVTLSCESGTNVSLSLNGTPAAGNNANNTVIALTGEGNADVASGIGVQLGLQSSGYNSGSNGLPLNQSVTLFSSSRNGSTYSSGGTGSQEQLIFSASYFKTGAVVTAGSANSSASITLTYN
ncbi:type 1 fimbrial protein [Kluyvera cryocrescens]|uniref:type 1 fimbrial protein n=1 Tax=Kluyvera cryocrescens TaxID=580 RepID=UPI002B0A4F26|nr:type 1 fimbrial protein [Kluyvera cryocrescens]